jgi:hypothetical protein
MNRDLTVVVLVAVCSLLSGCANETSRPEGERARSSLENTQIIVLPAGLNGAAKEVAIPVPTVHSRVIASKLVSHPELEFRLAELQWQAGRVAFLMYQPVGSIPSPVASIASFRSGNRSHVWLQRLERLGRQSDQGDVEIATIERLYALALEQDAEARFCFTGLGQKCDSGDNDQDQAAALRELYDARQRAIARTHPSASSISWQVVSMTPAFVSMDEDQVGVRVVGEGSPLVGVRIFFNQAPDSFCSAETSKDGVATCQLVDQEGDDAHPEGDKAAVVANFAGVVGSERILLPTTLLMKPRSQTPQ